MATVLGLDIGANSIGWALVEDSENPANSRLIDIGVRVFPEGVDAFDTGKEQSRNEARRMKRGMRRQTQRRAQRRRIVKVALTALGLWTADKEIYDRELQKCPYELRANALRQKLTPFELGRVFLNLNQRRGFLSNRKKDRSDKEAKGLLAEINRNEQEQLENGFATVGAMLAAKAKTLDHAARRENDHIRNRHLSRKQYVEEFNAIWEAQRLFHPMVLTDEAKYGHIGPFKKQLAIAENQYQEIESVDPRLPISKDDPRRRGLSDFQAFGLHGLLFFQRKMYWPKSVIGLCELESKEKRCPKADRRAERFRVLQEVNNLRFIDANLAGETPLNSPQRKLLLSLMETKESVTFDQIRKKLNFLDSVKFNLERGERSKIKGFALDVKVAGVIGKDWYDRPEDDKDAIVRLLFDNESDDDTTIRQLTERFNFTLEKANDAVGIDFPPGYIALSLKAINRLMPHLERGLVYQSVSDPEKSALHAAGYLRRDELQRRLFDKLPNFARLRPSDCKLGDIPNPVVKRALVELRKLVNALIAAFGKPAAVHIEMARSLQMGLIKRQEYNARIRAREGERDKAAEAIKAEGVAARRESILRYLLWKEQSCECVYCGKNIGIAQLLSGGADVDHILPYSRSLDDSQLNKVVCHRECNHDKNQRTPYEWLAAARPADYARVCQQVAAQLHKGLLPYPKYRRFLQKELELDSFIARQLTDTAYITRASVEYLQLLFDKPSAVLGLKGQLTAELRWQWGLDTILEELPDSPAWQEKEANKIPIGEKNRADHRHHSIDALVVALTNRKRLQKLSSLVRKGGAKQHGEVLPEPWDNFRDTVVARVKAINVSHRVERKVAGALHEETNYGPVKNPDGTPNPNEWVVRKPVENLSPAEVERIRDGSIKQIVLERLRKNGIEFGRGKKPDPKKMKAALTNLAMPSGVPIKKVRILKNEQTIQPLRAEPENQTYVKPGSTHHLCIFEYVEKGKTKRDAVFVTMLEATNRLKRKEPVIQRFHPDRPDAKFIMSLSSREMVLANWNGRENLLIFKTAASTQGQIYFAVHTDARRSSDQTKFVATANSLKANKVAIDPIGRIRRAND